ncbi:MAG: hypothetical protein DMG97_40310 [Acidobacteria bacterium]|nr:MAG: hypothetical protein DMG97_40310 [Acidobacteriota bacterium]
MADSDWQLQATQLPVRYLEYRTSEAKNRNDSLNRTGKPGGFFNATNFLVHPNPFALIEHPRKQPRLMKH